jgi:triacylglycerol lipase
MMLLPRAFAQGDSELVHLRMDRLEAEIQSAEDLRAVKRLQRVYGYYLDKGLWEDLADLFTQDAVAKYPAGTYIGYESIRRHLFMNVGGGEIGENGLGHNRLYNHMNIQPVVHLDEGGETARGRWRAFAYFGSVGGTAAWAEGVYEMGYVKEDGVWKIDTLAYHSGFGAPYSTGWVPPDQPAGGGGQRGPRNLPHPPDEPRNMPCEGFPDACIAPFHYASLVGGSDANAWLTSPTAPPRGERRDVATRATRLAQRAALLEDEQDIENLIKIAGYYLDQRAWDHVADLFANDATIEVDMRGVYVGRERIRAFLELLGPQGLSDGELNDHVQLQFVVDVAADGLTAKSRSRSFNMTGRYQDHGTWSDGIFTNTYVKQDGVWKFQSVRYYPTFITDYDEGWANDAQPVPGVNPELPPDRPPSDDYDIYPTAHIPPYHYDNPVTGAATRYPEGEGRPSRAAIRAATLAPRVRPVPVVADFDAALSAAERTVSRVKDYHELENLENAYGYYLDKNLWEELSDLFAGDGSMELAQRGVYVGRERVRDFLYNVFGAPGPVPGRLGNHVHMQPVIHVADDGRSAKIRSRMLQQLSFGPRASMGAAIYENDAVKEDGVWKFKSVHAYNTWTAGYEGGWARSPGTRVPGPSESFPPDAPVTLEFAMFPNVYELPFHYDNPVSGRASNTQALKRRLSEYSYDGFMPPEIAQQLSRIGARIESEQTSAIYAPLHPSEPYAGVNVLRDQRYGRDARNTLDVFTSSDAGDARPVLVFVYGGGFRGGDKHTQGSPFYDNVMLWAVREGMVGVNVNYRLAPENTWPSGIEDIEGVLRWLEDNIAEQGGDPAKVILWGHSSGGAHVADYLAARARAGGDDRVAGAVLLSSFYDLGDNVSTWAAYYGNDVRTYDERSSLPGLLESDTPLLVVDAELDPDDFKSQARLLAAARAEAGKPVRRLHLAGHSHLSEGYAVGTSDRSLTDPVKRFVESVLSQ